MLRCVLFLDLKFDIGSLDAEKIRQLNKLGMKYGISSGAFSSLLQMDRREQDETHQLKEIEKAKHALAVCNSLIIMQLFCAPFHVQQIALL